MDKVIVMDYRSVRSVLDKYHFVGQRMDIDG